MGIVYRIKQEIKAQKTTIAAVERELGLGNGTISKWDKQSPSCNNMLKLANYLNCSIDYILTGKENSLPTDEQELLTYYKDLDEREKALILGEAKGIYMAAKMLVKQPEKAIITESNDTPKLQRAYMVSRSTDNTPPRFVEGDFSDILNAPDATDEY